MRPSLRKIPISLLLLASLLVSETGSVQAGPLSFPFGGRLTEPSGQPLKGPVNLGVSFYHAPTGGTALGSGIISYANIPLAQGVFSLEIDLPLADFEAVFPSFHNAVYIEVVDLTNNKVYPRQRIHAVPFASKVPVDGQTISFDTQGQLTVGPSTAPAAGQFITRDGSGFVYATPPQAGTSIQGQTVSSAPPALNQILQFDGTEWKGSALGSGTVSSLSASSPMSVGGSSFTPALELSPASASSGGFLSSSDWLTFSAKQNPLGFAPVNKASDSLSGTLNFSSGTVQNLGLPTSANDAATKAYVDSILMPLMKIDGTTPMLGAWAVGNQNIYGVKDFATKNVISSGQASVQIDPFAIGAGSNGELRFQELSSHGTNYIGFKAPDQVTASVTFTLPHKDGVSGHVLQTDGAGNLRWIDLGIAANSVASVAGRTGHVVLTTDDVSEASNLFSTDARVRAATVDDAISDGVTDRAPSQNAVFDALALKVNRAGDTLGGSLDLSNAGLLNAGTLSTNSFQSDQTQGLVIDPYGVGSGETGSILFRELIGSGAHSVGFKAPDSISSNQVWALPAADGSAGQLLTTNGTGFLAWLSGSSVSLADALNDGVSNRAPSQNATYDDFFTKLNTSGGSITGPLSLSAQKIENLAAPTNPNDAATKNYADSVVTGLIAKDGSVPLNGPWGVGGFHWSSVGTFSAGASSVSSLTTSAQAALTLQAHGTAAGETSQILFQELSGGNYLGFRAPDALANTRIFTLPAGDGAADELLKTNGSAALGWTSASSSFIEDAISDGVTDKAPSQNIVYDSLTQKLDRAGGTLSGPLNMNTRKITNLSPPTLASDAASLSYADGLLDALIARDGSTSLSGSWNFGGFNLTGVGAFSAAQTTLQSLASGASQAAINLAPWGATPGDTGEFRFPELAANGSSYVGFRSPDAISDNAIYTLPASDGTINQLLRTDGSEGLSWFSPSSLIVFDGIRDGVSNTAPSENAVFDALALKVAKIGDTLSGNLSLGGFKITGLDTPTAGGDAVNKSYADALFLPYLRTDGTSALTSNWAVGGFNLTGISALSGGALISGTLALSSQAGFIANPYGLNPGNTGEWRFKELNVVQNNFVGFKAADAIANSTIWRLPSADGSIDQLLTTNGNASLSFTSASSNIVTQTIGNGVINRSPSEDAVFGALGLKLNLLGGTLSGTLNMGNQSIEQLASPTQASDAANKSYVDGLLAPYIKRDGTSSLTSHWDVGGESISGVGTFSASNASVTSLSTSNQAGVVLLPYAAGAGQTSEIRLNELAASGSEYVGFKSPDAITTSQTWILPAADGLANHLLKTNGASQLGFASESSLIMADAIVDSVLKAPTENAVFDALAAKLNTTGGTLSGTLNMGTQKITNLAAPSVASDTASKTYVDTKFSDELLRLDGTTPLTGNWSVGGYSLSGINSLSSTTLTSGSLTTNGEAAFTLNPFGIGATQTGEFSLKELAASGTHSVGFRAPDSIAANTLWTLPSVDGSPDFVLRTNGLGLLSWVDSTSLSVQNTVTDGVTTTAPSQNAVFDALANRMSLAGGTMTDDINMGNSLITNLPAPSAAGDLATRSYTDGIVGPYLKKDGSTPLTGAWNAGGQNLSGVANFSASATTLSRLTSSAQGALVIDANGGNTSELRLRELSANGAHYVGFKAPTSITADRIWTLPGADGSSNQVLITNASGSLSWVDAGSLFIDDAIVDGVTARAPSQNAVFDALALKLTKAGDTMSGPLAMSSQKITGLGAATVATDAITKTQADAVFDAILRDNGSRPLTSSWAVGGHNLSGVANLSATSATLSTLDASTFTTGSLETSLQSAVDLTNNGGAQFQELAANGTSTVELKTPAALAGNTTYTWPATLGNANDLLKTNAAGVLSWASVPSLIIDPTDVHNGDTLSAPSEGIMAIVDSMMLNLNGGTMTGVLNLPTNGLSVPTNTISTANGNVGFKAAASASYPLSIDTSNYGPKIGLWATFASMWGIGVQANLMQFFTHTGGASCIYGYNFGYGDSSSLNTNMRINGCGQVGIGTNGATDLNVGLWARNSQANGTEASVVLVDSNNGTTNSGAAVDFRNASGYLSAIVASDDTAYDGRMEFRVNDTGAAAGSRITSASSKKLTLFKSGNAVIRTGSEPSTADGRLTVYQTAADGAEANALILDSNNKNANAGTSLNFKNMETSARYQGGIAGLIDANAVDGKLHFRVDNDGVISSGIPVASDTGMTLNRLGHLGLLSARLAPNHPFDFGSAPYGGADAPRISFYGTGNSHQLGINNLQQTLALGNQPDSFDFGYGNSGSLNRVARLWGTKKFLISTIDTTPLATVHIKGGGFHVEKGDNSLGIAIGECPHAACTWPYETMQLHGSANLRVWHGTSQNFQFLYGGSANKGGTFAWENISDIRTKNVHRPFESGLEAMLDLEPIVYSYKKDNPYSYNSDEEYVGFSAQDVQKTIPEAIKTDDKGYLNLTADPIIWTMLNGIKEEHKERTEDDKFQLAALKAQDDEIALLTDKLKSREERLEKVEDKLERLKRLVCQKKPTSCTAH